MHCFADVVIPTLPYPNDPVTTLGQELSIRRTTTIYYKRRTQKLPTRGKNVHSRNCNALLHALIHLMSDISPSRACSMVTTAHELTSLSTV